MLILFIIVVCELVLINVFGNVVFLLFILWICIIFVKYFKLIWWIILVVGGIVL